MHEVVSSMWFTLGEEVTHLCGGHTEKEKNNKPKGTHTEASNWFNPTKLEDGVYTCVACGTVASTEDGVTFNKVGDSNE